MTVQPVWKWPMTLEALGRLCARTRYWRTAVEVEGADEAVEEREDVGAWARVELMGMSMW